MSDEFLELSFFPDPPRYRCSKGHEFVQSQALTVGMEGVLHVFCPQCLCGWLLENVPVGVRITEGG